MARRRRRLSPERVCCLMVLDSVTSTPQWIRQPKPGDVVYDVCVFECRCVLRSLFFVSARTNKRHHHHPRAFQPLDFRLCLFQHFGFLSSPHAIQTRSRHHPSFSGPLCFSTPVPRRHPTGSASSLALFTWASTVHTKHDDLTNDKPNKLNKTKENNGQKESQFLFVCFPLNQRLIPWPLSALAVFTHTYPIGHVPGPYKCPRSAPGSSSLLLVRSRTVAPCPVPRVGVSRVSCEWDPTGSQGLPTPSYCC
jgi:hypothetical protein